VNRQRKPGHLLVSEIEHTAVLSTAGMAARRGHQVDVIPVTSGDGSPRKRSRRG